MKFTEMPYTRPDYPAITKELEALTQRLKDASSAPEQASLYKEYETLLSHLTTQTTLCYIRHTVDTNDKFYEEENDYNDQQSPLLQEFVQNFQNGLLDSPYREELESIWASCCSRTWNWNARVLLLRSFPDAGGKQTGQRLPEALRQR